MSQYAWPSFRNSIKNKNFVFEGKEFTGWDLPMHEQIRLFNIQEAKITEVANYANLQQQQSDTSVNTAPVASKQFRKKAKTGTETTTTFQFDATTDWTGSGALTQLGTHNSIDGHYIDFYVSQGGVSGTPDRPNPGQAKVRLAFLTSSNFTATASDGGTAGCDYFLTCSVDLSVQTNTTTSILNEMADQINTLSGPFFSDTSFTETSIFPGNFFTATVTANANVTVGTTATIAITTDEPGTVRGDSAISFNSATASVVYGDEGRDYLVGVDGKKWSTVELTKGDFKNVMRMAGSVD